MKRREFIVSGSLVTAGLFFANNSVARILSSSTSGWKIYPDGTFDINTPTINMKGCYPAMDDEPMHSRLVTIKGNSIFYKLKEGEFSITLSKDSDSICIDSKLKGISVAPRWIYPIAEAQVQEATCIFKQGLGFGGPSGIIDVKRTGFYHDQNKAIEKAFSYDSYMTSALISSDKSAVAIGSYKHNNYLQRSTFYNKIHRSLLVDKVADSEILNFEAGFATENISVNRELALPTIHVLYSNNSYDALHNLAVNIAKESNARNTFSSSFHYDTWYEFYSDFDYKKLDDFMTGLVETKPAIPFKGIIIDAGWSPLGDWLDYDEKEFPGGLKAAFERITKDGYTPGGYFGPFMVSSVSKLFKEHPDWILKDLDGNMIIESKGRPTIDNRSLYEERFFLDTSHPDAFEYLRNCFRTFRKWGVKYYKTDFMEWGLKDSTKVKRHTPGKTSVQYYVDVCKMIREEIGDDSYWLGCIAPFAPMIGFVDGMRVAYDTGNTWGKNDNIQNMFQETIATHYFNTTFWQNDPDVAFFRSDPATMPLNDEEILSLALWIGMLGGVVATSDRIHKLHKERLDLLRFIIPDNEPITAKFPFWDEDRKIIISVRDYKNGTLAVLFINSDTETTSAEVPIHKLTRNENGYCFNWGHNKCESIGLKNSIAVTLNGHCSQLIFINNKDVAPDRGMNLAGNIID